MADEIKKLILTAIITSILTSFATFSFLKSQSYPRYQGIPASSTYIGGIMVLDTKKGNVVYYGWFGQNGLKRYKPNNLSSSY